MVIRTVEMDFEYLNYIDKAPRPPSELYSQACAADGVTVAKWRDTWIGNAQKNKTYFGNFHDKSIGKLWGTTEHKPAICIGSGPSLKRTIPDLQQSNVPKLSCLHNFHFLEDNDVKVDYYVSLDAGDITISEISKGGTRTHEEYLEKTRNKTLLAYIGSHPDLLRAWKGEILFFTAPIPDKTVDEELKKVEEFNVHVSSGGNVLGACVYIAKAIMGSNPLAFVGADFCFDYTKNFHSWKDDTYSTVGHALRGVDIFGNKVLTWQSYYNFKSFFDWLCETIPGLYINCTGGGILGAYPEGNIRSIIQMELASFNRMYSLHKETESQCKNPQERSYKIMY